jgi:uncharacterized protein
MLFKVKDIGEQGVDVDLPVTAAWLAQQCPDLDARPGAGGLRFSGQLAPSGEDFLLQGRLEGNLETVCSRCLEPATLVLEVPVAVVYAEKDSAERDQEEDTLDAPDVLPFEDGVVDLGPEIRDEILLAIPVSVLCQPECAGLCPVCGGNRNQRPCDCAEREAARGGKLAGLAKFKS